MIYNRWSPSFICDDKTNTRLLICHCIAILLLDISYCANLCSDTTWNGIDFVHLTVLGNYISFLCLRRLPCLINRSKISSIVNFLWVSIPLEEVTWWKAQVANEPPCRLEALSKSLDLLAYLNWNGPFFCSFSLQNFLYLQKQNKEIFIGLAHETQNTGIWKGNWQEFFFH